MGGYTNKGNFINKKFEHDRDAFQPSIPAYSRLYLLADAIAKGETYRQISQRFQQEWGVSPNYIYSLMTEAISLFQDKEYYDKIKDINNERLNNIFKEAIDSKDLKTAIKAVDTLNKANGVYEVQKQTVQVSLPDENIVVTFGAPIQDQNPVQDVPTNVVDEILKDIEDKE